jgi:ABC-2 type transport system permease protein
MAVYEQAFKPYTGVRTPTWSRFSIIARHAYADLFKGKIFTAAFAVCFVYPFICAIVIYLHHNPTAISALDIPIRRLIPINGQFFRVFLMTQCALGYFLNLFIGPTLVSRDLSNNALPLYLSRPFSRAEYVFGKMSVSMILLSLITWVPGFLLYGLQITLEGPGWLWSNLFILVAIFVVSWAWILTLSLLGPAVSAWVKWAVVARGALFGLFFIPQAAGAIFNEIFRTQWGNVFNLWEVLKVVARGLFHQSLDGYLPVWAAWASLLTFCVVCLLMIVRKVRAYEVIR